jgi:hypothetical protein
MDGRSQKALKWVLSGDETHDQKEECEKEIDDAFSGDELIPSVHDLHLSCAV